MSHYAKVVDAKVVDVMVADDEFFETFVDSTPGEWIQTSYNTKGGVHLLGGTPLRYNYAGIGYTYDKVADAFYEPQPYPSWTLSETTYQWEPPVAYPEDGSIYYWNEETQSWDAVETE